MMTVPRTLTLLGRIAVLRIDARLLLQTECRGFPVCLSVTIAILAKSR